MKGVLAMMREMVKNAELRRVVLGGLVMAFALTLVAMPVMAKSCGGVETAIFECGDGTEGEGVKHILNLVVEIMTIGVGILGVIGITIVGLQYLTAGGNEEQTRKAKRRMFEIVIGIVVYVVLFALLNWLIPDFHPFG